MCEIERLHTSVWRIIYGHSPKKKNLFLYLFTKKKKLCEHRELKEEEKQISGNYRNGLEYKQMNKSVKIQWNRTHKQTNKTPTKPTINQMKPKQTHRKKKKFQMKPTSRSLYALRLSRNREIERSTKKRKVRVMNLCCREK